MFAGLFRMRIFSISNRSILIGPCKKMENWQENSKILFGSLVEQIISDVPFVSDILKLRFGHLLFVRSISDMLL